MRSYVPKKNRNHKYVKLVLGLALLFAVGALASGALGQATEGTGTSTDTTATDTTAPSTTDTTAPTDTTTTDTTATTTEATPTEPPPTAPASSPLTPTISSDLADYPPGGTVTLTGAGWGPGESVHLFVNDSAGDSWSYNVDLTADEFGSFTNSFQLPNWFVANYGVAATGATGETATASFTDASLNSATLAVRKSDCSTAPASFTSADTVCAHSQVSVSAGGTLPDYFVEWLNPSNTLVFTDTHPGVANNAVFDDSHPVTALGTWTVKACKNTVCSGGNLMANPTFSVNPRPASALNATANGATEIDLSWTASPDGANITDYKIIRTKTVGGGTTTLTAAKNATSLNDTGLVSSSEYCYTIRARFTDGTTDFLSTAAGPQCATTASVAVTPTLATEMRDASNVANTSFVYGTSVHDNATLTAAGVNPTPTGSVTFRLFKGATCSNQTGATQVGADDVESLSSGVANSAASGLGVGTFYYLVTYSSNDTSKWNSIATATCEDFSITARTLHVAADPQTKVYGDSDPALSYSVTTADLQFSDTAASVLSGALTRAAGQTVAGSPYAITKGTLAANDNYSLAFTPSSLTITARPISLKANDVSRIYGDSTPAFSVGVLSGSFAPGESVSSLDGTASFDSGAPAAGNQPVGSYRITLNGLTSGNYEISFAAGTDRGTLTITRRPLTITASSPADIVVGSPVPTVTPSYGAFAPGDDANSLTAKPTCSTAYTTLSPVGTYGTSCSGAVSPNYTFTYNPGSFKAKYATGLCLGSPSRTILQPVNTDGTSLFKQGSTVPAKFRVCDANGNSIGTAGVVTGFTVQSQAGTAGALVTEDIYSTTPDTTFRWSATDQQWIFNISTKPQKASTTYIYTVSLNDGTNFTFQYALK
jgi:hypothetical protein